MLYAYFHKPKEYFIGYYSETYKIVYYDGYGYNFYYTNYGYYEYSIHPDGVMSGKYNAIILALVCITLFCGCIIYNIYREYNSDRKLNIRACFCPCL